MNASGHCVSSLATISHVALATVGGRVCSVAKCGSTTNRELTFPSVALLRVETRLPVSAELEAAGPPPLATSFLTAALPAFGFPSEAEEALLDLTLGDKRNR